MGYGCLLGSSVGAGRRLEFRRDVTIGERPVAEARVGDRQAGRLVPVRRAQRDL